MYAVCRMYVCVCMYAYMYACVMSPIISRRYVQRPPTVNRDECHSDESPHRRRCTDDQPSRAQDPGSRIESPTPGTLRPSSCHLRPLLHAAPSWSSGTGDRTCGPLHERSPSASGTRTGTWCSPAQNCEAPNRAPRECAGPCVVKVEAARFLPPECRR